MAQNLNQEINTGINNVPATSISSIPISSQQMPHYNILLSNPLSNLQTFGQNNLSSQITLLPSITNLKTTNQIKLTQQPAQLPNQSQNWQGQTIGNNFPTPNRLLNHPIASTSSNPTTSSNIQNTHQSSPKVFFNLIYVFCIKLFPFVFIINKFNN